MSRKPDFYFAYMPWLNLYEKVSFGRVKFLPWIEAACEIKDDAIRGHIEKHLNIYKDSYNQKTGELLSQGMPCIILIDNKVEIDKKDFWLIKSSINLLFYCIVASNQPEHSYFNSGAFHHYIQSANIESDHITLVTHGTKMLRRGGSIENMICFKPLEVCSFDTFTPRIEMAYVEAIDRLTQYPKKFSNLSASIDFLFQASDDWYGNFHKVRIAFLISAIETLIGRGLFRKEEVLEEMEARLRDEMINKRKYPIIVKSAKKKANRKKHPHSLPVRILAKAYDVRNSYLHQNSKKDLGYDYKSKKLPLLNLMIEIYLRLVSLQLEKWKLLKVKKDSIFPRKFFFKPLDKVFEYMADTYETLP